MDRDILLKAARELYKIHKEVCYELGDHPLAVDTIYSHGAEAIEYKLAMKAI